MGSGNIAGKPADEIGIIPRVMQDVFRRLAASASSGQQITIRASYIEIYNDEVRDLLFPGPHGKPIAIRERGDGTIVLAGVREVEVATLEQMQALLEEGSLCRTVAGTLMNSLSSRSHSIFTIAVEQRRAAETIAAKFHLVDLAGSERAKRTGNAGLRLKESVNINAGLLALGNVISALGDDRRKTGHVPYRESKLTRMLQDSLGGNSRTLMIACIRRAPRSPHPPRARALAARRSQGRSLRAAPRLRDPPAPAVGGWVGFGAAYRCAASANVPQDPP